MRSICTRAAVLVSLLLFAWRAGAQTAPVMLEPAKPGIPSLAATGFHGLVGGGASAQGGRGEEAVRTITCPTGSSPEGEANCGLPNDFFNGGCSSFFPSFTPLDCGQMYCGTSAYNGSSRDTDWYVVSNISQRTLVWTVTADFRALIGVVSGTNGSGNCAQVTGLSPFVYTTPGQPSTITACLGPGTWWFFVAPDINGPVVPCGTKYIISLNCGNLCTLGACCVSGNCSITIGSNECAALNGVYQGDNTTCTATTCNPPANDNCINATPIVCGGTYTADLRNATMEVDEFRPACGTATVASVWFKVIGTGQPISVSTCSASSINPAATDSVIAVYQGSSCSGITASVSCNDDAGCGATGLLSSVCFNTSAGVTYLVQVMAYDNAARATYQVQVSCPCEATPSGACCLPFGQCVDMTRDSCDQNNGYYRGDGTKCATTGCPNLAAPTNDDCDHPVNVAIPSLTSGYNFFASDDQGAPDCGIPPGRHGVWYKLAGDGQRVTASVCQPGTDFDTRLLVYCGDCVVGNLTPCVGANEDGPSPCGAESQVTWCSALGQVYSILVTSGAAGTVGHFDLQLSSVPGAASGCIQPAYCSTNPCVVTCPQGALPENEADCGGAFVDTVNGGCGTAANARGSIQPGQTVCGTSGNYQPTDSTYARDTDWFRFTITQQSTVTWQVTAEFLVQIAILTDNCSSLFTMANELGNACEPIKCSAVLNPGTYDVFVSPQFFIGTLCGSHWVGSLTAVPTTANGACCLPNCTCTVTTQVHCQELGGISFGGNGTTCAGYNCDTCRCDLNFDGIVNTFDLAKLLSSFGLNANGDVNCDGVTNTFDLAKLLSNFGVTCPGVVP